MARLIRLDHTGHSTLAEWTTDDQAAFDVAVEEFKAGKGKAIGAIVGFVMRETKGRADGGEVNRLIREKIGA